MSGRPTGLLFTVAIALPDVPLCVRVRRDDTPTVRPLALTLRPWKVGRGTSTVRLENDAESTRPSYMVLGFHPRPPSVRPSSCQVSLRSVYRRKFGPSFDGGLSSGPCF